MVTEPGEGGKVANKTQMTSMEDIKTEDPKVLLNLAGGTEVTWEEGKEAITSKEELGSEEESTVAANSGEGGENNKKSLKSELEDKSMDSSDQESPRGVLEIPVSGAESDGGSSSSESSPLDQSTMVESRWKRLTSGLLLKKKRAMRKLLTFPQATTVSDAGLHRRLARIQYDEDLIEGGGSKTQVWRWRSSWRSSGRQELIAATDNFSSGTEEYKESLKVEPTDKSMDNSDQESPRGVLEISISDVEADGGGSISKSSSLDQSIMAESHNFHWKSLISRLLLRKKKSIMRLSTFPPAMPSGTRLQRVLAKMQCDEDQVEGEGSPSEIPMASPSWRSFDCQELADATDNFSPEKLIGKGGHAEVYKGCLPDGQLVAVKKLTKGDSEDRIRDFLSELGIIGHVNHPNAAQLLGFSVEEGLHLVLKFSPHGSLASVLHGSKDGLDWGIRFKISLGIAQGLLYLHEGCQRRIIHRDIKASNILLTDDYQPQISDFGLAKWLPDKWSHHIVFPIEGTFGYLAPEYFMHGIVNEKTDVFAFGVLLLELITGRKAVDPSRQSLVTWAKPLLESCNMKELIDPSLMDAYDPEEARSAISAASMCIHHLSTMRPNMNWVVRLLKGEERVTEFVGREPRRRPLLFDAGDPVDYTCSRYLNDLHRHKELAMEQ